MARKLAKDGITQRVAENEALIALGAKQNFEAILNIGMGLKGMKDLGDDVGWRPLGYKDFEDYTVSRWNLARIQATKYVRIVEKLPKRLCQSLTKSSKASVERLFQLLPNDTTEFKLSPDEVEQLMLLPPDEFKDEVAKISGYDREKHGGRGPSDLERPQISRDRYRDQQKKINRLEEKFSAAQDEKDELVGELGKAEKLAEDLKRVTSPDKAKNELIQENKGLLLKLAETEKLVMADKTLTLQGDLGMQRVAISVGECLTVFNRLGKVELTSHEQWCEFRAYTDTIRRLLDLCEERIGVTMAEKGLFPKEYEEWHEGSFKYHLDKATETMRREYAEKTEKETDEMIEKAKEERQQHKKTKKKKAK